MRSLLSIIFFIRATQAAPCEPLDGIFVKNSGPSKLTGSFKFTRTHFDMNLNYAGSPYRVENIPYSMVDVQDAGQGCELDIAESVLEKMPKNVREDVGLRLVFLYKGMLHFTTEFDGFESLKPVTFKKQGAQGTLRDRGSVVMIPPL
ncbi:hypothetical protein FOZ63_003024 [Perkinsus olseni]|uniref:Uncharacterized protein n=1 Tax=Perkinsus olseni TaxID=32597 RepID=A0A7J6QWH9_PEROL|nr:hypothetical protein FOZ63_003024 [Perkinsus olseni]